ncbi:3'-5' exoribonuclease YhaM family protein [Bremerella sp. T1]|uniref:3'-5' exoribonuclease YhaM family protein n=1 Tax=Bremerella sp. TYQ1 TaxID=3119568 RepID=UPI001CCD5D29|nr:HD domain-containing protein [Bremerella volcania]UBM37944.1 HD domain-containing protein [Bremerella volcania]
MSRRSVTQLGENENINEVYVASGKQLRPNRQGNLYLQMQLSDKSGSVNAMMWNASDAIYKRFEDGDYVRIQGTSQFYNGAMQVIVSHVERIEAKDVDESDFMQVSPQRMDEMLKELGDQLRAIRNIHLRNLAECFLIDEDLISRFRKSPAAIKNHHAYEGGLLEHVVSLIKVAKAIVPFYPQVDEDLLVMGVLFHDIGKVDELSSDKGLAYSDEGQLIGHLVSGVSIVDRLTAEAEKLSGEKFPEELALRIKHMVVSHHGKLEFGSPKVPMTAEALALHYIDSLDAHMHGFDKLLADDMNSDSNWTSYSPQFGRKLFKGSGS